MTRPVAAGEPSMEEILASIRKIIAEEPGSEPAPLPRTADRPALPPIGMAAMPRTEAAAAAAVARPDHPLPAPPVASPPPPPAMGRLADALGGRRADPTVAGGQDDDLSDLFDDAEPVARSPAGLKLRDASASRTGGLPLPGGGRRELSELGASPGPREGIAGRVEPTLAAPAGAGRERVGEPVPVDLGALVPKRPEPAAHETSETGTASAAPLFGRRIADPRPATAEAPPPPRGSAPQVIAAMPPGPASVPVAADKGAVASGASAAAAAPSGVAAASAAPAGPPAARAPVAPSRREASAAAPQRSPQSATNAPPTAATHGAATVQTPADPETSAAAASALDLLAAELKASSEREAAEAPKPAPGATPAPAAPAPAPAQPIAAAPAAAKPTPPAVTAPGPAATSAPQATAPAPTPPGATPAAAPAKPTAASAPTAPAPAAQPGAPAPAAAKPAAPPAPAPAPNATAPAATAPAAGQAGPAAQSASATTAPAPGVPASASATEPPGTAAAPPAVAAPLGDVRTLEDTVVELLRPMLRKWLDDNMPRIVEKALRVEIARSTATTVKPE